MWQVNFAPEKTPAMVITLSPAASHAILGLVCFGGKCLPLEQHIKILGMAVDRCLRFDYHIATVVRQISYHVSDICRIAGNLDGILTLYKAQIRLCMEYGALTWMSSTATHVQRLDVVQRRAIQLVDCEKHQQPAHVTSLEHRHEVSALVVFHKAQVQEVPHLSRLRLSPSAARGRPDQHSQVTR